MNNGEWTGILIILGIIAIALFGGSMKSKGLIVPPTKSGVYATSGGTMSQNQIQNKIKETQAEVVDLQKQVALEESKKTQSKYYGQVLISYVSRYSSSKQEYIQLRTDSSVTTPIPVTGWVLKSSVTGQSISIPQATYLYFTGMQNYEDTIQLQKNEVLYLFTGYSPNGASFKVNKCSGYLQQFQTFSPSLSYSCPLPKNEDLSSIPQTVKNEKCLEYIDRMSSCRIQTESLPVDFSYECTNFIYNKINYPSCVDTHKNDKDFYKGDWRVYLKRNDKLWKDTKENITLYDNEGKVVTTYSY